MQVTVVGLGKLGLPLAALLANAGYKVAGYDRNKTLVESLSDGSYVSQEKDLDSYIKSAIDLTFVSNPEAIPRNTEIFFFIVPTPSIASGEFSNHLLIEAIQDLGEVIKESSRNRCVVLNIVSTVMPGSCSKELRSTVEKCTDLEYGREFTICYNPEFIALGSVIHDMQYPDMHLIGCDDEESGKKVELALSRISKQEVPSARMNLVEAELVKIAINNFVTMKIAFANGLMQASRYLGSVDINRVTEAIGMDSRIGTKYLRGSMPYGGPCFPRDTRALMYLYEDLGVNNDLARSVEESNILHAEFIANLILAERASQNPRIGLAGISYKSGTPVIEDSPAVMVGNFLLSKGNEVYYWDDEGALYPSQNEFSAVRVESLNQLLEISGTILITRDAKEITRNSKLLWEYQGKIVDPWGVMNKQNPNL